MIIKILPIILPVNVTVICDYSLWKIYTKVIKYNTIQMFIKLQVNYKYFIKFIKYY